MDTASTTERRGQDAHSVTKNSCNFKKNALVLTFNPFSVKKKNALVLTFNPSQ